MIILIINLDKKVMKLKSKIFINILILFFSLEIFEIKAHNNINGGCKDHCSTFFNRGNENKIKIFKKDEKLIKEQNSCVKNSLCRG